MIVANFDGRNVHAIFDAVEFKVLLNLINQATVNQVTRASQIIGASGFDVTPNEVTALAKAALAINKNLLNNIENTAGKESSENDGEEPVLM